MPDATVVKVIVDAFGWPIVTVAVLLVCLWGMAKLTWRMMGKHEGQMEGHRIEMSKMSAAMTRMTDVNENILSGFQAVAAQMTQHDRDEERRHRDTQDRLPRRGDR